MTSGTLVINKHVLYMCIWDFLLVKKQSSDSLMYMYVQWFGETLCA